MPIATGPGAAPSGIPDGLTPAEFARLFALTPEGAAQYLAGRDALTVTYDWRALWQDEHAQQFTVSRLTRLDLLKAVQEGITQSVGGDLSRRDFARNITQLLQKAGWWGNIEVTDPSTGEVLETRFDPRRVKLIYDTNTRMAHSAGRWERIQEAKGTHPYLRYITKDDARVRVSHAAWHNLTLPVDDPWWQTHYPPNGWGCRCRAMAMSQRDYDKGLSPKGDALKTVAPDSEPVGWLNKLTGEVEQVPNGIDPGFAYNVGEAAGRAAVLLKQKLAGALQSGVAPVAASATLAEVFKEGVFTRWHDRLQGQVTAELAQPEYAELDKDATLKRLRQRLDDKSAWPVAVLDDTAKALLEVDSGLVQFSAYDAIKQMVSRSGQDFGPEDYLQVQATLDAAKLIVELGAVRYAFLPQGRKVYMAVLHVSKDRKEVYLKSFRHAFGPEEVKALRKRGRVLKDEWDGGQAQEGDSP
jgi:SPP1 gp7 family putative phage head morphogenesis protein